MFSHLAGRYHAPPAAEVSKLTDAICLSSSAGFAALCGV
jgi:hypothetical protein